MVCFPFSFVVRVVPFVLPIGSVASFSATATVAAASGSRNGEGSRNNTIVRKTSIVSLPQIPRIPASEFDPNLHYYRTSKSKRNNGTAVVYETPVIVEGVLSEEACEKVTDELVAECGGIEVTLQRKRKGGSNLTPSKPKPPERSKRERRRKQSERKSNKSNHKDGEAEAEAATTTTDLYLCSFLEAIDLVLGQSKHDDALLAFCEGLLNIETVRNEHDPECEDRFRSRSLQQRMEDARERLFQQRSNETDASNDDPIDPCWFKAYFPTEARPTDCVILAGKGATSTLHRDPLEWTGTNLCLDGTKVWRFIAPPLAASVAKDAVEEDDGEGRSSVAVIDGLLDAYRLDSIAWGDRDDDNSGGDETMTLSAGWQSDYSLFSRFRDEISSTALSELEEEKGTEHKLDIIRKTAADVDRLQPDIPVCVAGASANESAKRPGDSVTVWSGVQKPGDMIIIPAHWWHQTYGMEASLAIASQRCGAERDSERVLRHILETTAPKPKADNTSEEQRREEPSTFLSSLRSSPRPQEAVDRLFDYLAILREDRRKLSREG